MKKRVIALVLMLVFCISIFVFIGCGISGEEVTQEVYDKAMSGFTDSVLAGNIQADITNNSISEYKGKKTKVKATYTVAVQDNVKSYSKTLTWLGKLERFMEKVDNKTYRLYKLSTNEWRGAYTEDDLFSIIITATGIDIIGVINVASYDSLSYEDGKYYYSSELLEKARTDAHSIGIAGVYNECYIAIKDEKIIGMNIKYTSRSAGDEGEYTVFADEFEIKFSYSPKITLPKYSIPE